MRERRGEHLPDPRSRYPHELVLDDVVGRPDDDPVALGDDVVDGPGLLDRPEGAEQHAQPLLARRQAGRPSVHAPVRSDQLGQPLDVACGDEVEEGAGEVLVMRQIGHGNSCGRSPARYGADLSSHTVRTTGVSYGGRKPQTSPRSTAYLVASVRERMPSLA